MDDISLHIKYDEAVRSNTAKRLGVENNPNAEQLQAMKDLATAIFEPIREHFGVPIYISSFFRSKALNTAVKGSVNSQHMSGEAIDIDAHIFGYITNKQIYEFVRDNLDFDQLIWEYGNDNEPDWIHISYRKPQAPNRKQVLRIK